MLYAAFIGLVAFDMWSVGTVVWAAFVNHGAGSEPLIFWPAVALNIAVLMGGIWLTVRTWRRIRRRFASRLTRLS